MTFIRRLHQRMRCRSMKCRVHACLIGDLPVLLVILVQQQSVLYRIARQYAHVSPSNACTATIVSSFASVLCPIGRRPCSVAT